VRGMGKWLCAAYIGVIVLYLLIHAWSWSWAFALRAALWIFIGGSGVVTLFGYLLAKASMPRPAMDYLGKDGQVKMPLAVNLLTWSAFGVLLGGAALILVELFSKP
jgi:hypothetical protein